MLAEPGATILLDLDGTVCWQLPRVCEYLHHEYDVHVGPESIDEWSWPVPGHDCHVGEIIVELMCERPTWFLDAVEPLPGVGATLAALSAAGFELHVATHRLPDTHDVSRAWLDRHGLPYDRFVEDVPSNKADLEGDVLVDDYHGNVADAIAAGKTGILMRQPYSDPSACEGAHVVDGWDEVRALFDL